MCTTTIIYGDPGKRDPYIIKRVKLDGDIYYEVYRNDASVKWRYRRIADASTFDAAQRRMQEDHEMQIRLTEARQGGLDA